METADRGTEKGMEIQQVTLQKTAFLDLLMLADPQEDMIEKYLDSGDMFALYDDQGQVQSVCVVCQIGKRKYELKNLATREEAQGRGYGTALVHYVCEKYSYQCDTMYVGTGNTEKTIRFYQHCGFVHSHIVPGFFTANYREPIRDEGVLLTDMIYLKKDLKTEADPKRVLDLALEAGRILLKNGGEIFRVEETIKYICGRFHVEDVDIFTLSHAIIVSIKIGDGDTYTRVKHIPLSSSHLGIVAEVNALSREISAGLVGIDEAFERLKEIEEIPPTKGYLQILAAGMGSGCFGFLLGAGVMDSLAAFLIGCFLYVWVLASKRLRISKIIVNIVGGVLITFLALLFRHFFPAVLHLDGMIISGIMPLVPGMAFTNAIRDIADSDFLSGTVRMIDALLVFVYIAIGVGFTLGAYTNIMGGVGI